MQHSLFLKSLFILILTFSIPLHGFPFPQSSEKIHQPFITFTSIFNLLGLATISLLSHVRLFMTPWTVDHWTALSVGFSKQEIGVGCPSLFQGIFLTQGSKLPLLFFWHCLANSFSLNHLGSFATIMCKTWWFTFGSGSAQMIKCAQMVYCCVGIGLLMSPTINIS